MITRNTDYSIQRLRGLSTDTKPVNVPNGSEFREMDTGKKFLYSAAGTEWIEQPGSGGSGGGGSVEPLIVRKSPDSTLSNQIMDTTWHDIYDALARGVPVYLAENNLVKMAAGMSPIVYAGDYSVEVLTGIGKIIYETTEASGYPAYNPAAGG